MDALTRATILPSRTPASADRAIELAPDEAEAFALFASLGTQWRWHSMAGLRLGLIYEAVAPTAAMLGMTMTPRLMGDIQTMETAVLTADAEARA